MKKLLVALLAVMLVAGSAMALEFEPKGSYYVRGSFINNETGLSTDPEPYRYWDHELDMTVKMVVSDQTFVMTNFEIHDESWVQYKTNYNTSKGDTKLDFDDNIHFKKVYGSHTFSTGTQLDFGLMTGEAWATEWNDDSNNFYRVKVMHPFGDHKLYFAVQKDREYAFDNLDDHLKGTLNPYGDEVKDLDADDNNTYFLGLDAKLGDISVRPALTYRTIGTAVFVEDSDGVLQPVRDQDVDASMVELTLGVEGEMGSIGFEGELAYESASWDVPSTVTPQPEDYSVFGAYFKGWMDLGTSKVGGLLAYGSYDDDAKEGFGFGEDFAPTGLGASWYPIGETGLYEYNAVTLLWLFAEFEASEALSFDGGFAYWMSNSDGGATDKWKDANGYELNAGMSYKITDAVTYSAAAQWGQINQDKDQGTDDTDPATRIWHRLKITF